MSNILRRSSRKRSAPRTLDSTAPSQPSAARQLPVTTQAIHHGQISTAPIVRTTSMPSTITQAVPKKYQRYFTCNCHKCQSWVFTSL